MLPHARLHDCSARPDGHHMYTEQVIIEGDIARQKAENRAVKCVKIPFLRLKAAIKSN